MAVSIKGIVHYIGEVEHFGEKQTAKRIVAIEVKDGRNGEFVNHIPIEWMGDKAEEVGNLEPGQEVEVHFNIRGREYKAQDGSWKYFVSLAGWKWQVSSANTNTPAPQGRPSPYDEPYRPDGNDRGGPAIKRLDTQGRPFSSAPQGTTSEDDIPF